MNSVWKYLCWSQLCVCVCVCELQWNLHLGPSVYLYLYLLSIHILLTPSLFISFSFPSLLLFLPSLFPSSSSFIFFFPPPPRPFSKTLNGPLWQYQTQQGLHSGVVTGGGVCVCRCLCVTEYIRICICVYIRQLCGTFALKPRLA